MANNSVTRIQIPVDFVDANDSAQKIMQNLKSVYSKMNSGSSSATALGKSLFQLEEILTRTQKITSKGLINKHEAEQVTKEYEKFQQIVESIQQSASSMQASDFKIDFSTATQEAAQLQQQINTLQQQIAGHKSTTKASAFVDNAQFSDKIRNAARAELSSLSIGDKDVIEAQTVLSERLKTVNEEMNKQKNTLKTLKAAQKSATDELQKYESELANLNIIQQEQTRLNTIQNYSTTNGIAGVDWQQQIRAVATKLADQSGIFTTKNTRRKNFDVTTALPADVQTLIAAMVNKQDLSGLNQKGAVLGDDITTKQEFIDRLVRAATDAYTSVLAGTPQGQNLTVGALANQMTARTEAEIKADIKNARTRSTQATKNVDTATTNRDNLKAEQSTLNEMLKAIQQPVQELQNKIATLEQQVATLQAQLDAKNTEVSSQASSRIMSATSGLGAINGAAGFYPELAFQSAEASKKIEQANNKISNTLDNLINRFFGMGTIINYLRRGIRTAISDIKSLDQSMTNIAVVTNMTTSDLWNQINTYMTVARQYGVTTQGVYEVSQLYYQQGLKTAEVNELTGETLKLARISGMDYKEAANAMTVALRSFNIDMSEAARVTDVYSKVASISATDSNELAIAMSKTASGAANVGSTFENTTAMLAVMIEATRESAQNLGSALKSIISRYGELKTGNTTDENGEIIDYNKVDTALKSVGISIKDAQGQFRDFDDVIMELSEKWDTLDSVSQRY